MRRGRTGSTARRRVARAPAAGAGAAGRPGGPSSTGPCPLPATADDMATEGLTLPDELRPPLRGRRRRRPHPRGRGGTGPPPRAPARHHAELGPVGTPAPRPGRPPPGHRHRPPGPRAVPARSAGADSRPWPPMSSPSAALWPSSTPSSWVTPWAAWWRSSSPSTSPQDERRRRVAGIVLDLHHGRALRHPARGSPAWPVSPDPSRPGPCSSASVSGPRPCRHATCAGGSPASASGPTLPPSRSVSSRPCTGHPVADPVRPHPLAGHLRPLGPTRLARPPRPRRRRIPRPPHRPQTGPPAGRRPAQAQLVELPRCGHMPMLERRHEFSRLVDEFTAKNA